jgi:hypothetical protein
MATATTQAPTDAQSPSSATSGRTYRCECGHTLRVFGSGRHQVFFAHDDERLRSPVMDRACPNCRCGLPGKNRPGS